MKDVITVIICSILALALIADCIWLIKSIVSWIYNFFYRMLTGECSDENQ